MSVEAQTCASVLMVRPSNFGFNSQTAASNAFQTADSGGLAGPVSAAALREFDALAAALQDAGVRVIIGMDTAQPIKPDAVFPNNWVSFHADGTAVLYPMEAPNRRLERREDLLLQVAREGNFRILRTVDLTAHEIQGKFLEGTGSLVLDRPGRLAYACSSSRTQLDALADFARTLDYRVVSFDALGADGSPVYHTNVVMSVGKSFAVLCAESIPLANSRASVAALLRDTGHELVEISMAQMQCFAGNLLELDSRNGPVIAISALAWEHLDAAQRRVLEARGRIVAARIPTIERIGGGSVRCMLAEIHLPQALA
jgi:hypothetical protein